MKLNCISVKLLAIIQGWHCLNFFVRKSQWDAWLSCCYIEMSSVVAVSRSVDLIVVPDGPREHMLDWFQRGEADRECGIIFNTFRVPCDNLITVHHIPKAEGDLDIILSNSYVSMVCVRAPACSKFDGVSSKNINIVEAFTVLRNIEPNWVSVVNVLFDLSAFEVWDLSF